MSPFEQDVLKRVRQTRKTSTPGTAAKSEGKSPRKRAKDGKVEASAASAAAAAAEGDEEGAFGAKRPRRPPAVEEETAGAEAAEDEEEQPTLEFKTPSDAETIFVVRNPTKEQVAALRKVAEDNSLELEEMKRSMDDECFRQLCQSAHRSTSFRAGSGRSAHAASRRSDVTTLSANSQSSSSTATSSSTGYHADGSSGTATNSSEGSKRSRESMRIEEPIETHRVQSPLPKYPLPKPRPDRPRRGGKRAPKVEEEGEPVASLPGIPEAERESTPVKAEQVSAAVEEPVIHADCVVFAKFKEGYSSVRFWPAVVQRMVSEGAAGGRGGAEWEVEFVEDKVRLNLKTEDLVPAAALRAGDRVTHFGFSKGQSKNGVLASHPDLSQFSGSGVISYHLQFDKAEAELVPHANIFLKAEQAKAIKRGLGGEWATPTKAAAAAAAASPSANRLGDISLDNLVDNKRRSTRTAATANSTPSSTVTKPKDGGKEETSASGSHLCYHSNLKALFE